MKFRLVLLGHQLSTGLTTLLIVMLGVFIAIMFVNRYYRKKKDLRLNGLVEGAVDGFLTVIGDYVESFVGKKKRDTFTPLAITLFLIIFFMNILSTVGLQEGASDLFVPVTFAISMFLLWTIYAIFTIGPINYIKDFFSPIPIMFPVEILSTLAVPVSLSMRMFGNILSGYVIMLLFWTGTEALITGLTSFDTAVFNLLGVLAAPVIVIGGLLTGYFSLFSPFIQALVFMSLTLVNISVFIEEKE
ncbi:MAG: F0F1 ATP synthase subunit A [Mycoplasmatales bacterium]